MNLPIYSGPQGYKTLIGYSTLDLYDFLWAEQWEWGINGYGYVCRGNKVRRGKSELLYLHREILSRKLGRRLLSSGISDHKDGQRLNNSRANLRVATARQNTWNRRPANKTGFKGVWFNKRKCKYVATIYRDGSNRHLGHFDTPEEAARRYDRAALELHGEYARLNFGPPV